MLSQIASRSNKQQVLRLLLASSHSHQAAAVTHGYATDDAGQADEHSSVVRGKEQRGPGHRLRSSGVARQQQSDQSDPPPFDAAAESAPLRVHQLIGDPRTGVADDTTTAPFNNDIQVEHIFTCGVNDIDWFRYSMAGDQLPYMHMDARLSDHSKNMMYLLRCKDPKKWTIPALAEKFRIRRQRVMAILAFKEIQAHKITAGESMPGPLQHYVFNVPLADLQLDESGQPLDLAEIMQQQEAMQQQQQQQGAAAAAAAASQPLEAAEGLGSLEDFLAAEDGSSSKRSSIRGVSAADQAADLAVLMPHVAVTAQQLQVQLLQLLQSHHYSIQELQQRLLQQIDVAEAYYQAHVQGTPLDQLLLAQADTQQPAAAAAADAAEQEGPEAAAAATKPLYLDFDKQRQVVQQLVAQLEPLLAAAGPQQDREAGRLLVQLQQALQQQQGTAAGAAEPAAGAAEPAAASSASEAAGEQQQQPQGLSGLVEAADPVILAAAFNKLSIEQRQQLLDAVPQARITLNIQGTDLRAALSSTSTSSSTAAPADSSSSSSSSSQGEWPGQVPTLVDLWSFQEVPRRQLAALQEALPDLQQLLQGVGSLSNMANSSSSSSSSSSQMSVNDIASVQQSVQVYSGLLHDYDDALTDQAAMALGSFDAYKPSPAAQRRLARILREIDPHAVEKLLLWESVHREAGTAEQGGDPSKLNRLRMRVAARVKELDKQAADQGFEPLSGEYPDLPASVPEKERRNRDLWAAVLEATVVGRQFHRGSGDKHFMSVPTYPKFEGRSLQEFDSTSESEISIINRLAAERQDNVMWREFRTRLLRNMGLLGPELAQHSGVVKPPKPAEGWSWVVHPVGGAAKELNRRQLKEQAEIQWMDEQQDANLMAWHQQHHLQSAKPVKDPARGPSPQVPYVAEPGGTFRSLNEEEALVVGDTRPKPRKRWFASKR